MVQVDNMMVRCQLIKTWDDKQPQGVEVYGRSGERMGGTQGTNALPRLQFYGFTAHAPKESQGLILCINGNPDVSTVTGLEHPDYRPKDLAEGEFKLYDKWGHYLHAKESEWHLKVGGAEAWFKDGEIKFKVGSAVILMQSDGTVHLNPPS